jgi:prophage antirepressor-like protein
VSAIELFQYESAEIRTVDLPHLGRYAVAADICKALDIKDVSDAVARLDKADRASTPIRSGGQNRNMWVVSENGATDLVLDSRKPEARAFRRFLTHEVWPSIRDTGIYTTAPALTPAEKMAQGLLAAQELLADKDAQIAQLEPKAEFYDELMDSNGCYSMLAASKMIGWGRNVMMRDLRRMGVLQGNNLPYQRYEHHFKVVPGTYVNRKTGETVPTATAFVLPKGVEFLRQKLSKAPAVVSA